MAGPPVGPEMLDYRGAFEWAPVGLVLSRHRQVMDCNQELLLMFGARREQILGQSLEILYPTPAEFERTGQRIVAQLDAMGRYADERVMRRLGHLAPPATGASVTTNAAAGDLFWCHVSGRALDPAAPHAAGIWSFEDLSSQRQLSFQLTPREREIAAQLIAGLTSKLIGRQLGISPRTVDVYRGRLMRKTGAATTADLVKRLLSANH